MTTTQAYSPGLEGVIAGETELSHVNPDLNSLVYRGYDIRDLANHESFEGVSYLMLHGKLPNKVQLEEFTRTLVKERDIPTDIIDMYRSLPKNSNPMDLLRAGTAMLPFYDPEVGDNSHDANVRKATRLIAKFPALITAGYRISQGKDPVAHDPDMTHAQNFLYTLHGEHPDEYAANVFSQTLICYVDHGYNASTFAGRVTTSTLSDMHSGIVSAIGTLKGPLHGGANEEAMKMMLEIGSVDKAEAWVLDALATKKKIMGFGHRAYKTGDPRAILLIENGKEVCSRLGHPEWDEMGRIVIDTMNREKGILPNVDFPTAYIYYVLGLPIEIYTPIFALARVAGWAAHIIEQHDGNRLIRPKAIYKGAGYQEYTPVDRR
ncbi:MAG: citrate synthase [Vampirovibrio sp.]|nr:citrate synthase [Vampirovibrio sp.]